MTNPNDLQPGSLRAAIGQANANPGPDTIAFFLPNGPGTITIGTIPSDEPTLVTGDVTFDGSTQPGTIISASGSFNYAFAIAAGATVEMNGLTFRDGNESALKNSGTLTLTDCTIRENVASFAGGGLENCGTLTLINSTVCENDSFAAGGGIRNLGVLTLIDSTVSKNNTLEGGGGISNRGVLTLINSTVRENRAESFGGGGIENLGTLTLNGTAVTGNSVAGDGGGISNVSDNAVAITESTVSENWADVGGGIYNNSSGTMMLADSVVRQNVSAGTGGGIHNSNSSELTLTNCAVSFNGAEEVGGGIENYGTVTLTRSTVSKNIVFDFDGGGIQNFGTVTLSNSTISENTAEQGGGGGILNVGTVTLTNSTVSGNTAGADGGGIDNVGTLALSNSIIANSVGGDCYLRHGSSVADLGYNIVEDGSCITHATCTGGDPGLGPLADNGGPTQTHALLAGSSAIDAGDCDGGAVTTDQRGWPRPLGAACDIGAYELQAYLTVSNLNDAGEGSLREAVFFANALPGADLIRFAVPGDPGTITLTSGELVISGDVTIDGSTQPGTIISGDNASRVFSITSGSVEIVGLAIRDGSTTDSGGGILNLGGTLTLTGCTVSDSSAGGGGGIWSDGILTLSNSTISGNTAEFTGGGIYDLGQLTLTNSTVSGNDAEFLGGGIFNGGASPMGLTSSTISGNTSGTGGGIWNDGTLTMSNTIVANSEVGEDCFNSGTITDLGHNIVEDGSCISHATSTGGDPGLGPLADNGGPTQTHALLPGSIAIDAGDCAGGTVTTDQRGEPRPAGAGCDIGSFELQELPCPIDFDGSGLLDLADIVAFVTAFNSGDPLADLAEPYGLLDLADVLAFVTAFTAGCA